MTFRDDFLPFAAAEFPNDNPGLHGGAVWVCLELGGPPRPVVRPVPKGIVKPKPALPRLSDVPPARRALSVLRAEPERETEPPEVETAPEVPSGSFEAFVRALVEVALASGGTRAAAVIPALVGQGQVAVALVDEETKQSLAVHRIAEARGGFLAVTESVSATLRAWRDVLQGDSNDLSACGPTTLDTWGAELLSALRVGSPGLDVRRELRRRGVAAFGMRLSA